MSLKDELRKLSSEHRGLLMQAFEQGTDQFVIVRDDIYVGVNLVANPRLQILETNGVWSYGRLKTS